MRSQTFPHGNLEANPVEMFPIRNTQRRQW